MFSMKKQILVLLIALGNFGAHAQQNQSSAKPSFKDENLGAAYEHYIHLKNALVESNSEEAKMAASQLQKSLSSIPSAKAASAEAAKISASTDLTKQRSSFSKLSNEFTTLVKANKLTTGAVFVEYCPMANNNEGAYWLSSEKEIKNPYFGEEMLNCGFVKETLK